MRPSWQLRAACRGKSTELWFATANIEATDAAKAVCVGCAVRQDCLSYALADLALEGIWAGTDAAERRRLRRVSA
jgi:WhiB family redox-sensing transcriptional regulator